MNMQIDATEKTPKVLFNKDTGELSMEGVCIPELTHDFFKPIISFVTSLDVATLKNFTLTVNLHFFNTGISRYILELMKTIQKLKEKGVAIKFKWYYNIDDEDIEEAGRSYSFILNEPFEMVSFS